MADATSDAPEIEAETVGRMSVALAAAKGALEEIKKKVIAYDDTYGASDKAQKALAVAVDTAQAAIDDIQQKASTLKDKSVEVPTKAFSKAFATANSGLEQLTELANKYDEEHKLKEKVLATIEGPREKAMAALAEASAHASSVSAAATAALQGVRDGIHARSSGIAANSASFIFSTAAKVDDKYHIADKAGDGLFARGSKGSLTSRPGSLARVGE